MNNVKTIAFGNRHTPKQVLIDAMDQAETAKLCVVVMLDADDYVQTAWADGSMLSRVGMLDAAKLRMIDAAQEDEDG